MGPRPWNEASPASTERVEALGQMCSTSLGVGFRVLGGLELSYLPVEGILGVPEFMAR